MELTKKMETLVDEQKMMVASMAQMMEEVARERTQLTTKHYEETEQANMVLDRV